MSNILDGLKGQRVNIYFKFPMSDGKGGMGFPACNGTVLDIDTFAVSVQTAETRRVIPLSEVQYVDLVDSLKAPGVIM